MIQTILASAIVTFALIGLLSNFFFIFFVEATNKNSSMSKTIFDKILDLN